MKPSPATILVVDDETKALNLLRNLLEVEGYRVLCAASGPEALAAARGLPDVVLLDLMMPGMDGFEVCRRLRAEPALELVPIIMLTALDDRASRLQGLQAGADDFLSKPFDSAELRARLRTITRLNRYRRLYEEQARFEAAINHAPEAIVLAERDGTMLNCNAAFAALVTHEGLEQADFYACLPSGIAAQLRDRVNRPETAGSGLETPLPCGRRPDTVVEIRHGLVPWSGREIVQFHLRDLTERRALETQLLRAQRIELLGQLAGSVVHDMNNILTAIGGSAMLMEMCPDKDPAQHLRNIQSGVKRGGDMMHQLLLFARGSDGVMEEISPTLPVMEVADLVRQTFGRKYQVELQCEAGLPRLRLDATQLHQMVMNLCVNARDAMPEGGRLDLTVARRQLNAEAALQAGPEAMTGDFVTVAVRDNGTGIPPEVVPRLFDPFFTTKPVGKGTGLGLATVLRLARRHGGFVTLETALGRGTCFTCHFPVPAAAGQGATVAPARAVA